MTTTVRRVISTNGCNVMTISLAACVAGGEGKLEWLVLQDVEGAERFMQQIKQPFPGAKHAQEPRWGIARSHKTASPHLAPSRIYGDTPSPSLHHTRDSYPRCTST